MSLTDFTADDGMHPGQVFACRLEPPFRRAVVRVLMPTDEIVIGTLYVMLVDGETHQAIVRMVDALPDVWVVDEFVSDAPCRRRELPRDRWQPSVSIDIA